LLWRLLLILILWPFEAPLWVVLLGRRLGHGPDIA